MALDLNPGSLVMFGLQGVVLPLALAVGAVRAPTDRRVDRWAAMAGLKLSDRSREVVRARLGRVRRWRSLAALPLWWLGPWALIDGSGEVVPRAFQTSWIALAVYVGVGMLVEAGARPDPLSPSVGASLSIRSVADFVPSWIRTLGWGTWGLAAVLLPWALADGGFWAARSASGRDLDDHLVLVVLAGLALLGLSEFSLRRIAGRAQRGADGDDLAVDDALRATACAGAAASGVLVGCTSLSAVLVVLSASDIGFLAVLLGGLVLSGLSIGALATIVRQETLGYRRRHRQSVARGGAGAAPPVDLGSAR